MQITEEIFVAHTRHVWRENLTDYPASTYRLIFNFYLDDDNQFSIASIPDGDEHVLTVDVDSFLKAGDYLYQVFVEEKSTGTISQISAGRVKVLPNLAEDKNPTYWTTIYNNLKNAFRRLSERETESVSVMGQTIRYEDRYKLLGLMEEAKNKTEEEVGINHTRQIKVRFR